MFATLVTATLFFFFAAQGARADFAVNTPELFECQSVKITWAQSVRPYDAAVMSAADECGDPIVDLGEMNATVINWVVNQKAGSKVIFSILDADDNEAVSGEMTVQPSNDTSCLGANATSSGLSPIANAARTTLIATNTVFASPAGTTGGVSDPAVAAGAANAGELPNSSGATSSVRLPAVATVFGTLAVIAATLAL